MVIKPLMLPLLLLTLHLLPLLKLHLQHLPLPMLLLLLEKLLRLLLLLERLLHLLPKLLLMPLHLLPANNFVKHHSQKRSASAFLFVLTIVGLVWFRMVEISLPSRCGDRPSENLFQTACLFPL